MVRPAEADPAPGLQIGGDAFLGDIAVDPMPPDLGGGSRSRHAKGVGEIGVALGGSPTSGER